MKKDVVNTVAARAFANMKADKAEEFADLGSFAGRLGELQRTQKDVVSDLRDINPRVIPGDKPLNWSVVGSMGKRNVPFRQHAFEQLCSTIGFPATTMQKCPFHLAEQNLAFFMQLSGDRNTMMRTESGEVRAMLSSSYKKVNHLEIVRRLLESDMKLEVNYGAFSSKRMFLLVVDPDSKTKGPDGGEMSHCTLVGNSETGEGSFFAQDLWYDYICGNRNIWGSAVRGGTFRKRHVGDVREGLDELFGWLAGDRKQVAVVAKAMFKKAAMDMWTDGSVKGDTKTIEYLKGKGVPMWLSKESIRAAKERWPEHKELSRFNVISGMTAVAQALPVDKRFEVEELAGTLFTV